MLWWWMIRFIIDGKPKTLKRHRYSAKLGRNYHPSSKDKSDLWLQIAKHKPTEPYKGSVQIKMFFAMPRPKSHFRTGKFSELLKKGSPELHIIKPDIDNMIKFYLDIMQGRNRFFIDDSQVSFITATKQYVDISGMGSEYDDKPSVAIEIREI